MIDDLSDDVLSRLGSDALLQLEVSEQSQPGGGEDVCDEGGGPARYLNLDVSPEDGIVSDLSPCPANPAAQSNVISSSKSKPGA